MEHFGANRIEHISLKGLTIYTLLKSVTPCLANDLASLRRDRSALI